MDKPVTATLVINGKKIATAIFTDEEIRKVIHEFGKGAKPSNK